MISVIICTYKRANTLIEELECLKNQSYTDFELLIIDGSGDDRTPYDAVEDFKNKNDLKFPVHFIESEKGLTRQRNNGLKHAKGDIIAFFDDDVTFDNNFLSTIARVFDDETNKDVVGITGYDINNYPNKISIKLKLRKILGVVPNMQPGYSDHLGRNLPISILQLPEKPFEVSWLGGFCMIYKADKIKDILFDVDIPTYGGEDFDFSMNAGAKGRLLLIPELKISHNNSTENRPADVRRIWETSFGMGRSFKKRKKYAKDIVKIIYVPIAEFIIDIIFFLRKPKMLHLKLPFIKINGYIKGYNSL